MAGRYTSRLPTGAERQAAYADRQRARGLRQATFWLTVEERAAVKNFISDLRAARPGPAVDPRPETGSAHGAGDRTEYAVRP